MLILFAALFFAVTDAFALALDLQHSPHVAEFASADLHPALVLKFEGKLGGGHLDNNHFVVEVVVRDYEGRANVLLHTVPWKLNTRIFLNFLV